MSPKKLKKFWTLRVNSPADKPRWVEVWGKRHSKIEGFENVDLFNYRHGPIVFLVHERSGLAVAVANADGKLTFEFNKIWAARGVGEFNRIIARDSLLVNVEPKPK